MAITSTIIRNIKLLTSAQIVASVAGLFTSALLARVLGADGFGVLGFGIAFLSLLGIAASLSTDMYGAREIARNPNQVGNLASSIIGLRLILSIAAFAVFIGIVFLLDRTSSEKNVLLIQAGGIFVSVFVLDFLFQGLERMGINGLRQVFTALAILIGVFFFVTSPDDLVNAAIVPVVAGTVVVGVIWIYACKNVDGLKLTLKTEKWRQILSVSLPMAVAGITHTIIFNTDAVMLGLMSTNEQTGLYVSAFKIVGLTMVPAGLLIGPFFPSLSAGWDSPELRQDRSKTFAIAVLLVSLPLVVFIALNPELLLSLIFGRSYIGASTTLVVLMISMGVMYLRVVYGNALLAWNEERIVMIATLTGAMINVILNAIFIPKYGIVGAAYASLVSQIIIVLCIAGKFLSLAATLHLGVIVRVVVCCCVAASVAVILPFNFGSSLSQNVLSLIVNCGIFAIVYLGAAAIVFRSNLRSIFRPET